MDAACDVWIAKHHDEQWRQLMARGPLGRACVLLPDGDEGVLLDDIWLRRRGAEVSLHVPRGSTTQPRRAGARLETGNPDRALAYGIGGRLCPAPCRLRSNAGDPGNRGDREGPFGGYFLVPAATCLTMSGSFCRHATSGDVAEWLKAAVC